MNSSEKNIVISVLSKTFYRKPMIKNLRVISFPDLCGYLNKEEINFIKSFFPPKADWLPAEKSNPRRSGYKGKYLKKSEIPLGLISIKNQKYKFGDKIKIISGQYLLLKTYRAYKKLNAAMKKEIKTELFITSAYRSPAYQAIVFFHYLKLYDFDFKRTAQRVAFPYYSEHSDLKAPAVDFMAKSAALRGEGNDSFNKTGEYKWLVKNAGRFGFELSYPKRNKKGIIFEPWHWRANS